MEEHFVSQTSKKQGKLDWGGKFYIKAPSLEAMQEELFKMTHWVIWRWQTIMLLNLEGPKNIFKSKRT